MVDRPHPRVATMKVLEPANPCWEQRRRLLAQALRLVDADVVASQEVPIGTEPKVVDELIGPCYHVRGLAHAGEDGVGGALATRWPHRVVEEIDQRVTPRSRTLPWCSTLVVEIDAPAGRTLVVHHPGTWGATGHEQA